MEERGALLTGLAKVLNAGGSALLNLYDAATSIKIGVLPGEKEKLKGNIKAYEKKIERLYYEIGKEVCTQSDTARISAAGEASVKLVAEYRAEIEIIKHRIEEIETTERIERQRLLEEREAARRVKSQEAQIQVKTTATKAAPRRTAERDAEEETCAAQTEPAVVAESSWPEVPFTSEASTDAETGEAIEPAAEEAQTAEHEFRKETDEPEAPIAGEELAGATPAVIPADAGIQKPDWMPDSEASRKDQVRHDAQYPMAEASETEASEVGAEIVGPAESEALVAGEELPGAETEEEKGVVAEPPETEKEESHQHTAEELENMLKADLLALCTEKGIEADRKMTKAQIIELIVAR